jgi:hypothetical protein
MVSLHIAIALRSVIFHVDNTFTAGAYLATIGHTLVGMYRYTYMYK